MRRPALPITLVAVASLAPLAGPGMADAGPPDARSSSDVLISEYVEGTGNNKALELANGTASAVDLGAEGYRLELYFNGNSGVGLTVPLTGVIERNDVFVVANTSASTAVRDVADQLSPGNWFNGDDAIVVRKGGAPGPVVDSVGQVGFD